MTDQFTLALVATVKNERASLDRWLAAISTQTRVPDHLVIVDGGSTDGTWEQLSAWSAPCDLTLLRSPGSSISAGRNLALRHADADIVAITDCGTVAHDDWLARLCEPFGDPNVDVSAGFFYPEARQIWDHSLAATTLPDDEEIDAHTFLPSSRSVALRMSWIRQGFEYPEWLDYCEDIVWDLQLKRAGARFVFVPQALVRFAPRPNWQSYWRQYYHYARGDGKAILFTRRHLLRYASYIAGAVVVRRRNRRELVLFSLAGGGYLHKPVMRLWSRGCARRAPAIESLLGLALLPFQRMLGDIAKMCGYPAGLAWRVRHYGIRGLRVGWQRTRTDGSLWYPSAPVSRTRPPVE